MNSVLPTLSTLGGAGFAGSKTSDINMKDWGGILNWRVRAIRGATTVDLNSEEALREAVKELLDALMAANEVSLEDVVSVIFSVTPDIDVTFPSKIARETQLNWDKIPLLDVQHMQVQGSLAQCIRVLIQVNSCQPHDAFKPVYLRKARALRPDLDGIEP